MKVRRKPPFANLEVSEIQFADTIEDGRAMKRHPDDARSKSWEDELQEDNDNLRKALGEIVAMIYGSQEALPPELAVGTQQWLERYGDLIEDK